MVQEVQNEKHRGNKLLWGALGVLLVAILGLAVAVVVVTTTKGQQQEEIADTGSEEEVLSPAEQAAADYAKVDDINRQLGPMSVEEAQAYLDKQLPQYLGTSMEFRVRMMKLWVYINDGWYDDALALAETMDEESYEGQDKVDYYNALIATYAGLGNEDMRKAYMQKRSEQYMIMYGEEPTF